MSNIQDLIKELLFISNKLNISESNQFATKERYDRYLQKCIAEINKVPIKHSIGSSVIFRKDKKLFLAKITKYNTDKNNYGVEYYTLTARINEDNIDIKYITKKPSFIIDSTYLYYINTDVSINYGINFYKKALIQAIKEENDKLYYKCWFFTDAMMHTEWIDCKRIYNEDITVDNYLDIKDVFFNLYFSDIKLDLDKMFNDELHKKMIYEAEWMVRIHWAIAPGRRHRRCTVREVAANLIKLYKRYYKVYRLGIMPPGTIKLNPDPTYQNFKNRMKIVLKDIDIINYLDR